MGGYTASLASNQGRVNRIEDDATPYMSFKCKTWNREDEKFQKDGRDLADTREFPSI